MKVPIDSEKRTRHGMTQLIICRGLPASGKTTFARTWVAEDPAARARVNKDDLRRLLHDGVYLGRETENTINMIRDNMIRSLLRKGIGVVNDDTNLPQQVARDLARIGREFGAEILVEDLTNVDIELCIARDHSRDHQVGEEVILRMAGKLGGKGYPLPFPEDPISSEVKGAAPFSPNRERPGAWLVDIDGTLAHKSDRSPFDWHRVGEDSLNLPVHQIVCAIVRFGLEVVILSGRDSVCRPETEEWLKRHRVPHSGLLMRPEGDHRKDSIVKRELLDEVSENWNVLGVLDDRNQVVKMWREVGLPCFQVADGDF